MVECIDFLGDAKDFSSFDANASYRQIDKNEDAKHKTAFVTHHGLFQDKQMLFGLKNSLETIQLAMDVILSTVRWKYAPVYLNLVVAFSQTPSQHIEQVTTVLRFMRSAGLTLNLKKYFFFTDTIN